MGKGIQFTHYCIVPVDDYRMGTNFQGWLNFAVFEGKSQTAKNNPSDIL